MGCLFPYIMKEYICVPEKCNKKTKNEFLFIETLGAILCKMTEDCIYGPDFPMGPDLIPLFVKSCFSESPLGFSGLFVDMSPHVAITEFARELDSCLQIR